MKVLDVKGINAAYGGSKVLHDVSLSVPKGSTVALLGRNGAGKTTTIRCICGLLQPTSGTIHFEDEDITRLRTDQVVRRGIVSVTEDRGIFTHLSVRENLSLVKGQGSAWSLERVLDEFSIIRPLLKRAGGALSGGEQQLVAIARALMLDHSLLLLDEPSQGLAPIMVDRMLDVLIRLCETDLSILIVEQKLDIALEIAKFAYVLENGRIVYDSPASELTANPDLISKYLGVSV